MKKRNIFFESNWLARKKILPPPPLSPSLFSLHIYTPISIMFYFKEPQIFWNKWYSLFSLLASFKNSKSWEKYVPTDKKANEQVGIFITSVSFLQIICVKRFLICLVILLFLWVLARKHIVPSVFRP